MSSWMEFVAALAAFFLAHVIPSRPPVRAGLVRRLGLRGYVVGYSLLSVGLLIWLIVAAARAPYVEVIAPLAILRWVPLAVMPVVCLLAVAGIGAANPLSFGSLGRKQFDPAHPGVLAISRHPLLLALMLWSLAHLLANGDLAHVILFGLFAGFAVLGMSLIDRRKRTELGRDAWLALSKYTARLSLGAMLRTRFTTGQVLIAAGVLGALVALHAPVIGVSPLP